MINSSNKTFLGWWTYPYFQCSSRRWILTYSIPVTSFSSASTDSSGDRFEKFSFFYRLDFQKWKVDPARMKMSRIFYFPNRLDGLLSVDVAVSTMDINQCGERSTPAGYDQQTIMHFTGTHKCHQTSTVVFLLSY